MSGYIYRQIHYDTTEDVFFTVADYVNATHTMPAIGKIKASYIPYPPIPEPDEGFHTQYQGTISYSI